MTEGHDRVRVLGLKVALTSVKRVTKMKAPAESGQASWSHISRTWLKHAVTSTAEELCLACCTGSSCSQKEKQVAGTYAENKSLTYTKATAN